MMANVIADQASTEAAAEAALLKFFAAGDSPKEVRWPCGHGAYLPLSHDLWAHLHHCPVCRRPGITCGVDFILI